MRRSRSSPATGRPSPTCASPRSRSSHWLQCPPRPAPHATAVEEQDMATSQAISTADLWKLIHEQREKVGTMLGTLTDAEWEAASLCAGWRVRDVVAHMVETQLMTPPRFVGRFAGAGFNFDKFAANGIAQHSTQTPAQLLPQDSDSATPTTAPPRPKATC